MSHPPVDTRVTAYVFGELSAEETAAFEQELQYSAPLREEVAATREAVAAITAELEGSGVGVNQEGRAQIQNAIGTASLSVEDTSATPTRWEKRHWITVAALAAGVLFVVGLAFPELWNPNAAPVTQVPPADRESDPQTEWADSQVDAGVAALGSGEGSRGLSDNLVIAALEVDSNDAPQADGYQNSSGPAPA
ncbi:MAG: hypothetical protein MI861_28700, partial [Pirellulales bacterium]|nr:hypothetical protein [Pirellulales bacterium]